MFSRFEQQDAQKVITEVAKDWYESGAILTVFADQLEALARSLNESRNIDVEPLVNVDWGQLAEHYAEVLHGVDEDEDLRRQKNLRDSL